MEVEQNDGNYRPMAAPPANLNEFDFIHYLDYFRQKLLNDHYVKYLDSQLSSSETLSGMKYHWEYKLHFPRDAAKMLSNYIIKIDTFDRCNLDLLDTHLKIYLHTMILYFMKHPTRSADENVQAAILYGKLILTHIGREFFTEEMFKYMIFTVFKHIDKIPFGCITILNMVGNYIITYNYRTSLQIYLQIVSRSLFKCNKEIIKDYRTGISAACQIFTLCSHILASSLNDGTIFRHLLSCFHKPNLFENSDHQLIVVQNTCKFIQIVFPNLSENQKEFFIDALALIVSEKKLQCFNQLAELMPLLTLDEYKDILLSMISRLKDKENLDGEVAGSMGYCLTAFITARFYNLDPEVNIIYKNIINEVLYTVSSTNITPLSVLLELVHFGERDPYHFNVQELFSFDMEYNSTYSMLLKLMLACYEKNKSISTSKANAMVLKLVLILMKLSPPTDGEAELIGLLCFHQDATNLRPYLKDLHQVIVYKYRMNFEEELAITVCNIFYKCAVDNSQHSVDFLKFLYDLFTTRSFVRNESFIYTDLLLKNKLENLFKKFETHNLYSLFDLENQLNDLGNCNLEFTIAIANYFINQQVIFHDMTNLLDFIVEHRHLPIDERNINYYVLLLNFIEYKTEDAFSADELDQLKCIHDHVLTVFLGFSLPADCFQRLYSAFLALRETLDLNDNALDEIKEAYNSMIESNMLGSQSISLQLASEFVLATKSLPSARALAAIEKFLEDKNIERKMRICLSTFYSDFITLYANMAILDAEYVPLATQYLQIFLESNSKFKLLTGLKLIYAIAKESTHDFNNVIINAFNLLDQKFLVVTELALFILGEVIAHDYLKMNVEQFLLFVHFLGNPDSCDYLEKVLEKHFLENEQRFIAKNFIHVIFLMNKFEWCEQYKLNQVDPGILESVIKRAPQTRNIYKVLFKTLDRKLKISISYELVTILNDFIKSENFAENSNWRNTILDCFYVLKLNNSAFSDLDVNKQIIQDTMTVVDEEFLGVLKKMQKSIPLFTGDCVEQDNILTIVSSVLNYLANNELRNTHNLAYELFETCIFVVDNFKNEVKMHIRAEKSEDFLTKFRKLLGFYEDYGIKYYEITPPVNNPEKTESSANLSESST